MNLEDVIKSRIKQAPLGSDEKNFLRMILGEVTSKRSKTGLEVVRDMLRSNEESLRRCRRDTQELARIELENTILRSLL